MGAQELWLAVAVVMLGYIVGFYFQHHDLDKLETSLNRRIDNLRSEMNARFAALHELLKSEIKRLEHRLERIEHPIVRG